MSIYIYIYMYICVVRSSTFRAAAGARTGAPAAQTGHSAHDVEGLVSARCPGLGSVGFNRKRLFHTLYMYIYVYMYIFTYVYAL